ncbi:MAG: DUF1064 domain-containing protein [Candidatus Sulfotelmatobacter sp.]
MTTKQAGELYKRTGFAPPAAIATPDASKYNARAKMLDGHRFDSTGEAEAYQLLKSWEACGAIRDLKLQPAFVLQAAFKGPHGNYRAIRYVADFSFMRDGKLHVVDFKGFQTPVYKIKRKMFLALHPEIVFQEWTRETLRSF